MIEAVTIGTRTSRLALWQAQHIAELLSLAWPGLHVTLQHFVTHGDKTLDRPLPEIGGKGLFTAELEQALLDGTIDMAVHSLKDLPVEQHTQKGEPSERGLTLGAVVKRGDVRDCIVAKNGWTLETLPPGAVVGTSSTRRQAQLEAVRPDLVVRSIRGNVDTRVRKALEGDYDAVILAAAGVQRLGLGAAVTQWLAEDVMLPAPGQGALAVQCCAGDAAVLALLAAIDDAGTRRATDAERSFLQLLGGGCSAPVGALARRQADGTFSLDVFAALENGAGMREHGAGENPIALAQQLADRVLGRSVRSEDRSRPLAGRRVVVTRPRCQAQGLLDKLAALGAVAITVPAIEIEPLADLAPLTEALARLGESSWIVFTSANAVEVLFAALDQVNAPSGLPPLGAPLGAASSLPPCRIAAVGTATQRALLDRGLRVDYMPDRFTGEEIAQSLEVAQGERVLLPRASQGGTELPSILAARGAIVDDVAIYQPEPAPLDAESAGELALGVDAVTFTSGSTARGFVAAIDETPALANLLNRCTIACIGPKTAEVVRQLGYTPQAVADVHTEDGLIEALVATFRGR